MSNLSFRREFTGWVRIPLSPNHIFSAFHLAQLSKQVEVEGDPNDKATREEHRSYVIGSILASVAFLEAAINELFSAAADGDLGQLKLDTDLRGGLAALWSIDNFRRGARLLEKYQCALQLAGKPLFDRGKNPYQDAKCLIELRNALVHFVPTTTPISGEAGIEIPLDEFGKMLQGKFSENPWKPKYALISEGPDPKPATWPFFPEGCLGSGCARWAAESAISFADQFFAVLELRWYFEHLRPEMNTKPES